MLVVAFYYLYRFLKKNVMLAGMWISKEKPTMSTFLWPILDAVNDLYTNGKLTYKQQLFYCFGMAAVPPPPPHTHTHQHLGQHGFACLVQAINSASLPVQLQSIMHKLHKLGECFYLDITRHLGNTLECCSYLSCIVTIVSYSRYRVVYQLYPSRQYLYWA